jgi:hypothetical protein
MTLQQMPLLVRVMVNLIQINQPTYKITKQSDSKRVTLFFIPEIHLYIIYIENG